MMDYPESLVRHLMETVRCSVCSASYEVNDVSVLGHQGELWFLTVNCSACHTQGLVAALVRGHSAAAPPPPPAELAAADARGLGGEPVSEDDVAEMHAFLKDFRGDIDTLLRAR